MDSYSARSARCPASGTTSDAGSTPRATSTSRSAARATSPLCEPKGATVATSAWATAATSSAGASVTAPSADASARIRSAASASRAGPPSSVPAAQHVQPCQRLERRAPDDRHQREQRGAHPRGGLRDLVALAGAHLVERRAGPGEHGAWRARHAAATRRSAPGRCGAGRGRAASRRCRRGWPRTRTAHLRGTTNQARGSAPSRCCGTGWSRGRRYRVASNARRAEGLHGGRRAVELRRRRRGATTGPARRTRPRASPGWSARSRPACSSSAPAPASSPSRSSPSATRWSPPIPTTGCCVCSQARVPGAHAVQRCRRAHPGGLAVGRRGGRGAGVPLVRPGRALPEIARVLRPGGVLAMVWNERDEGIPWVRRLGRLIGTQEQDRDPVRPDSATTALRLGRGARVPALAGPRPRRAARPGRLPLQRRGPRRRRARAEAGRGRRDVRRLRPRARTACGCPTSRAATAPWCSGRTRRTRRRPTRTPRPRPTGRARGPGTLLIDFR